MARSRSTLQRKHKILRVDAWPGALHGSSAVYIAHADLECQGRCNECTRTCQDGSTTAVAAGLASPAITNQFLHRLDALSQMRRHVTEPVFDLAMVHAARAIGVLLVRLMEIGWKMLEVYQGRIFIMNMVTPFMSCSHQCRS